MQVHVLPVSWSSHRNKLRAIREEVFVIEQGVPQELEWDGQDEDATHFMAVNEAGQTIGCARLLATGQIGRMAVVPAQRNRGIGNRLLDAAVNEAIRQSMSKVFLHAQSYAADFYRKAGFRAIGTEFQEAGIPHIAMELDLPIPFEPVAGVDRPEIRPQQPSAEPGNARLLHLHGESACAAALLECLQEPRRTLQIYSQYLDHAMFDEPDVVDALSKFVRRGPPARLQILIHSSQLIISRGHRLLELARRMDSKIQMRRVPDELASDLHTYVVWDETGYWLMPDFREYDGLANGYDPVQSAQLGERFTYLWHRSVEDSELRILRL